MLVRTTMKKIVWKYERFKTKSKKFNYKLLKRYQRVNYVYRWVKKSRIWRQPSRKKRRSIRKYAKKKRSTIKTQLYSKGNRKFRKIIRKTSTDKQISKGSLKNRGKIVKFYHNKNYPGGFRIFIRRPVENVHL